MSEQNRAWIRVASITLESHKMGQGIDALLAAALTLCTRCDSVLDPYDHACCAVCPAPLCWECWEVAPTEFESGVEVRVALCSEECDDEWRYRRG